MGGEIIGQGIRSVGNNNTSSRGEICKSYETGGRHINVKRSKSIAVFFSLKFVELEFVSCYHERDLFERGMSKS